MATTVDDLIALKDEAVALAHETVEGILAVWGEPEEGGAMHALLSQARAVVDHAWNYDQADECEDAADVEDYVERYAPDSLPAKVEALGWPSVADDLRDHVPVETVLERVRELGTSESVHVDELVALLEGPA